jgi:tripartite-type tricarboxylate transporter receptor subunit TctC
MKPIRVIVAYPPGGSADIISRILGQKLTDRFGQTMLIDNRAGAAGMIGPTIAAQATPDGYMLLLSVGSSPVGLWQHACSTTMVPGGSSRSVPSIASRRMLRLAAS